MSYVTYDKKAALASNCRNVFLIAGLILPMLVVWQVELVDPPPSAVVGERVTFQGFEGEPDDALNPKKKVWETLQVDLQTNSDLVACYKDIPLTTSAGVCKVATISNGSIR